MVVTYCLNLKEFDLFVTGVGPVSNIEGTMTILIPVLMMDASVDGLQ